jgi:hypothetical protein
MDYCTFKQFVKKAIDFNKSSEYFGIGLYQRPIRIISQIVRQILIREKAKDIQ